MSIFQTPESFHDLRIVEVQALPGFHHPFKCQRRELFEQPVEQAKRDVGRGSGLPWRRRREPPLTLEQEARVMAQARRRLTREDVAGCSYHAVDWARVAAIACELVQTRGPNLTEQEVTDAGKHMPPQESTCLWSLFAEPIIWHHGSPTLTNGQHRACGLWFSGALTVPVAPVA